MKLLSLVFSDSGIVLQSTRRRATSRLSHLAAGRLKRGTVKAGGLTLFAHRRRILWLHNEHIPHRMRVLAAEAGPRSASVMNVIGCMS